MSAEGYIYLERVGTTMGDGKTQIPVTEDVRERLRFVKLLSGSETYTETVELLFEESGFEPPEGGFDAENAKKALRAMNDA